MMIQMMIKQYSHLSLDETVVVVVVVVVVFVAVFVVVVVVVVCVLHPCCA